VAPCPATEDQDDPVLQVADPAPGPERETVARDLLEKVQEIFEGDDVVRGMLAAFAEGLSAEEAQRSLGISFREFEAGRRRLRRGIARHFPEGLQV